MTLCEKFNAQTMTVSSLVYAAYEETNKKLINK